VDGHHIRHDRSQMPLYREIAKGAHGIDHFRQVGLAAEVAPDQGGDHQVAQTAHGRRQRGAAICFVL